MATTTRGTLQPVPVEVYLRSSYEPDAEYVDGEIQERPKGEDSHSAWQSAILLWFRQHEKEWDIRVRPELRIQVAATRFRVPDVAILDRSTVKKLIATHTAVAIFEVLSPEDTIRRMKQKLDDYHRMGIPEIWVIDPDDNTCSRYDGTQLTRAESFSLTSRGILFTMDEIRYPLD